MLKSRYDISVFDFDSLFFEVDDSFLVGTFDFFQKLNRV